MRWFAHENSRLLHVEGGPRTRMSTGATWVRRGGVGATGELQRGRMSEVSGARHRDARAW